MGMLSVALRVVCVATAVLALTYDEQEATLNVQWVRFFFRAQMIYNSITLQLTSFPDSMRANRRALPIAVAHSATGA